MSTNPGIVEEGKKLNENSQDLTAILGSERKDKK